MKCDTYYTKQSWSIKFRPVPCLKVAV